MSSLDADLLAAIDARVAAAAVRTDAVGTIASITDDNDALVTFDGSTLAIPVKLAGNCDFIEGDRVALGKFGLWWVALVPLTRRWPSHSGASLAQSAGSTTAGAFSDTPVAVTVPFIKRWGSTRVYVQVTGGAYSTVNNTQAAWGAFFNSANQAIIPTYSVTVLYYNTANEHMTKTDWTVISGLAADTYTVTVRWSRPSGTGTVTCDNLDTFGINVMEISPT